MFSRRLKDLIDSLDTSISAFELRIGVSKGALAKPIKNGKSVGVEVLEKIFIQLPNVNLEWLVAGSGKMFKDSNDSVLEPSLENTVVVTKDEYIDLLRKASHNQDERIAMLEKELEKK